MEHCIQMNFKVGDGTVKEGLIRKQVVNDEEKIMVITERPTGAGRICVFVASIENIETNGLVVSFTYDETVYQIEFPNKRYQQAFLTDIQPLVNNCNHGSSQSEDSN